MRLYKLLDEMKKSVDNIEDVNAICIIWKTEGENGQYTTSCQYKGVDALQVIGLLEHSKAAILKPIQPITH